MENSARKEYVTAHFHLYSAFQYNILSYLIPTWSLKILWLRTSFPSKPHFPFELKEPDNNIYLTELLQGFSKMVHYAQSMAVLNVHK
jgi:hypothetical protein